nr:palindromic element RPE5 domain-containing protein [Rickettsia tillamookensis]
MEKSNLAVSRGAKRIIIPEHSRTYKDDIANFSSSSSILYTIKNSINIIVFLRS